MNQRIVWMLKGAVFSVLATSMACFAALADGGAKFLGNITTGSQVRSDMGTYWNQLTNENGCKWGSIHSVDANGKSVFNFNGFDSCENGYKWAKEKPGERHFKFHALLWGSQVPDFICRGKNRNITVEKTKQYITDWFDAVAAKFPDLEYIDVVNEAIWDGSNYHSGYRSKAKGAEGISTDDDACAGTFIIDALGGDDVIDGKHQYNFVKTAFEMARERWPNAVLIYNDYNTLSWQMNEGIEMVQTLLKNGAPIDAYGQQAHDCKGMSKSDFESKMTRIHNSVGIPLLVSEYDIGEADDNRQKEDYANQIPFMWETEWVAGITIWGYINGSTWAANTGIIEKDGRKRAAMVWLEDYFAKNLDKGQNTTGLGGGEPPEPVPQVPFGGTVSALPGKIEVENYDVNGVGKDEQGRSNRSFSDNDADNAGQSAYRDGDGVDLYDEGTGCVLGMTQKGEWLEYTVNFAKEGEYTIITNASSGATASSIKYYIDDVAVTDDIAITQTADNAWDVYKDFSANTTKITAGQHVLKLEITGDYANVDYFTFLEGANATPTTPTIPVVPSDTTPPVVSGDSTLPVVSGDSTMRALATPRTVFPVLTDYDVFDMKGAFMGRMSAYSFDQIVNTLENSNLTKAQGIYYLRNRTTGKMQNVRIVK